MYAAKYTKKERITKDTGKTVCLQRQLVRLMDSQWPVYRLDRAPLVAVCALEGFLEVVVAVMRLVTGVVDVVVVIVEALVEVG